MRVSEEVEDEYERSLELLAAMVTQELHPVKLPSSPLSTVPEVSIRGVILSFARQDVDHLVVSSERFHDAAQIRDPAEISADGRSGSAPHKSNMRSDRRLSCMMTRAVLRSVVNVSRLRRCFSRADAGVISSALTLDVSQVSLSSDLFIPVLSHLR